MIHDLPKLSNFTYNEITIGQTATYSKLVEERDIQLFTAASGDVNPGSPDWRAFWYYPCS
ncbi:MAG: hypothetical protein DRQ98_00500 [Gammaproteobacteria bacterium]|nr:MAG: hypothetical protein DRQ98_00500 [Gammaproteobacteria bacterium]